jgi:DNA-binding transcriptional LysR family regulator
VELTLRTATSDEVSDLVRRGEVTLGLRYGDATAADLCCEALFTERQVVAAAPDHRLAGTSCDGLGALAGERWITFPEIPGRLEAAGRYIRLMLEAAGVPESQILRIDSLTAQKRLVESGFGIALLPQSSLREELSAGSLTVLDVAGLEVAVPVVLVTRRDGFLSAAAQALLDELRDSQLMAS